MRHDPICMIRLDLGKKNGGYWLSSYCNLSLKKKRLEWAHGGDIERLNISKRD